MARSWSALTSNRAGLCLGLPMDKPALYRLVYDGAARQLQLAHVVILHGGPSRTASRSHL